jgi:hypothetical protein
MIFSSGNSLIPLSAVLVLDAEISLFFAKLSSSSALLNPWLFTLLFLSEFSDPREFFADPVAFGLSFTLFLEFFILQSLGTITARELPHPMVECVL